MRSVALGGSIYFSLEQNIRCRIEGLRSMGFPLSRFTSQSSARSVENGVHEKGGHKAARKEWRESGEKVERM